MEPRGTPPPWLLLLVAALLTACSMGGPPEMEPGPTGRIQGQPLLVMDYSLPLAGPGLWCNGRERWVLYDDGHILFCDTLLTHRREGRFRVAQMKKEALAGFLGALPRDGFLTEKSMSLRDGSDFPSTCVWLKNEPRWKGVCVEGWTPRPRGLLLRTNDLILRVLGRWRPPPPAFAEIFQQIQSVSLQGSVPLEADVRATTGEPFDWEPRPSSFGEPTSRSPVHSVRHGPSSR